MNTKKVGVFVMFWAVTFGLQTRIISAQKIDFDRTGKIRMIVSETEAKNSSRKTTVNDTGLMYPIYTASNTDFYFTYSVFENGTPSEKWIALSADRAWSRLSNQTVRLRGSLEENKLTDVAVSPLAALPENYLTSPPPTVGLYKVVVVPLTIQPLPPREISGRETAVSAVTPEAIRFNLFGAPNAVNKFYLEASFGKFGFTGVHQAQSEVVPVTIQATISNNCQEQIVTQFTPIVRQRLREQNIETNNGSVDLGIIIYNDTPNCPPFPFATRGALGQRGVPQWLWMPESWFVTGPLILAHEIGHTLGGNHPLVTRCQDFDNPQTCLASDDADRDIMTSGGRFYQMPNNYERRRWGWHPPGAFDNAVSGLTRIYDLHSPILPFVKDGQKQGRYYFRNLSGAYPEYDIYPEARRSWGTFERYRESDESFRLGVAVRIGHRNYGDPDALSVLLDPNNTVQAEDAPLGENEQISVGGVVIKCIREHNPGRGTRISVQQ